MSDLPPDLDLKFLPEWLKEAPATNRFSQWEGEDAPRDRRDRPQGQRPRGRDDKGRGPGSSFGKKPGGPGGSRDSRGPNRGGPSDRGQRGPNQSQDNRDRPPFENRDNRDSQAVVQDQNPVVRVDVFPEPAVAQSIAKQIKSSSRACSVFVIAKMFLERPERHRVKITALDPAATLYQIGDGPVAFDRAAIDKSAFRAMKDQFYIEETVQGEAPKGNFSNVARDRFSGTLLGPTSHHGYQVALRKLYEERYSRRMQFQDFLRQIETVSDPAAVEQWKQQASSKTVFREKVEEGKEAQTFATAFDAEEHFKQHHLPGLMKSGNSLEVSGTSSRISADRSIANTVRFAISSEQAFPAQMVNALRPYLGEAGLHYFKWRKKILYVCAVRPQRHPSKDNFSATIGQILTIIEEQPGINRPELATAVLGELSHDAPEAIEKKSTLASDLHYLIQVGHVIEFQNGALDLPPAPAAKTPEAKPEDANKDKPTGTPEPAPAPAISADAGNQDYQLLPLLVSVGQ